MPAAWALVLAVLMLGPAMGPGYVLSYDMVWVPDLALSRDALGLGSALPRAVPSDAVVAALDEAVGGMVLQKLVLLLPLVAAGAGCARLAGGSTAAQLTATSVAVWNPFVVERLVIGHWPVLIGYGVLPWLLIAGSRWRSEGTLPAALPVLLLLGSLSPTTGLASCVALAASATGRSWSQGRRVALLVVAANSPWLVSGLLHAGSATSSDAGGVFAAGPEGLLPAPLAALTLGGIWNVEVIPDSRMGVRAILFTGLVLLLALLGAVAARRRRLSDVPISTLAVCWAVGYLVAVLGWAVPDAVGWVAAHVPGGGLVRDGSRLLALAAPLTAVLCAGGAERVLAWMPDPFTRVVVAASLALSPVALMPDAGMAAGGRLDPVHYPQAYGELRARVADAPQGDVVLLPFESYRAPEWNDDYRPVLAPLGRYLGRTVVTDDRLVVDGEVVAGEDPRAAKVRAALGQPSHALRADGLRAAGVGLVLTELLEGHPAPALESRVVWRGDGLVLSTLGGDVSGFEPPGTWLGAMAAAWTTWLGLLLLAGWRGASRGRDLLRDNSADAPTRW